MIDLERRAELRGPITGTYIDMFGQAWDMYDQSKIWFVTNVGQDREEILSYLRALEEIEILEPNGIFKYIEIAVHNISINDLRLVLEKRFDCGLSQDC